MPKIQVHSQGVAEDSYGAWAAIQGHLCPAETSVRVFIEDQDGNEVPRDGVAALYDGPVAHSFKVFAGSAPGAREVQRLETAASLLLLRRDVRIVQQPHQGSSGVTAAIRLGSGDLILGFSGTDYTLEGPATVLLLAARDAGLLTDSDIDRLIGRNPNHLYRLIVQSR